MTTSTYWDSRHSYSTAVYGQSASDTVSAVAGQTGCVHWLEAINAALQQTAAKTYFWQLMTHFGSVVMRTSQVAYALKSATRLAIINFQDVTF